MGSIHNRDFTELKFIGLPQDLIVYAVRDKKADAGAVRTGILESLASEGKINITVSCNKPEAK